MEHIQSLTELRAFIQKLEVQQKEDARLLKIEFDQVAENMKPVNLIKNSIKDLAASPDLVQNLLKTVAGFALGYFSKKATLGVGQKPINNILATVLQIFVTNFVTDNAGSFKEKLLNFIQKIKDKFKSKPEEE
ncbi:MAG: hypothetical protein IPH93_12360 [Saprospiraceae bacterium]|nr:hypothetical protein [Saprospiraceae bacterium]MBK7812738.1 hypothetical protein [Saprospiraceae bacterium]MBK9630929.1 hypothetical protein [Saprospiraceae bacterium]